MLHRRFPSLLQNDVFIDVFANPRRTGILKNFLNVVFASGGVSLISNISLSQKETNRLDPSGKLTIVDVKAVTDVGETIQVEVQVQLHEGFAKRILYTWSQLYGRAIIAGVDYHGTPLGDPLGTVLQLLLKGARLKMDFRKTPD